jgi:hypothetical protein
MKIFGNLLLMLFSVFFTSCAGAGDKYNFVYKNSGIEDIWVSSSSFGEFKGGCGALPKGGMAAYKMVHKHGAVPDEVTVTWKRLGDGKQFEKKLKVREKLPMGDFKGDIIFIFSNNDVTLSWEKN